MDGMFFTNFIVSSLVSSAVMLLILLVKKGLKNHISTRWQYNLDLLFLVLLAVPLLPSGLLNFLNIGNGWFAGLFPQNPAGADMGAATGGMAQAAENTNWLQDFTISVDRASPGYVMPLLFTIWIAGIVALAVYTFVCNRGLRLTIQSTMPIEDGALAELFTQCKAELGVKGKIHLGSSIVARSPMSVGLFKTRIILPADLEEKLSIEDIRYILLHELTHCKNRDILLGYLMCLCQILYWFNPLVYIALREMRTDREIACDISVLKRLPDERHIEYGRTLLRFIERTSRGSALSFTAGVGGTKSQIKSRIERIASFVKESPVLKLKSIGIFALMALVILIQIPSVAALAAYDNRPYDFQHENVVYEDLSSYFEDYDGSFVLYDLNADQYNIYNQDKSVERVPPASTYKIYSALIAMDVGVIDSAGGVRPWDGTTYPYDIWNQDHSLTSAMQNSVSWYFQDLDAEVGIKDLTAYYERLEYGNHDLSGGIADYWMESSLRISPVEQVELLSAVVKNDTIFKPEHVDALKGALYLSEKDGAQLSGKTGTGSVNGKMINGWFVGYVESGGHTYVFATNIQAEDEAGGSAAVQITLSILKDKGIY